MSTVEATAPTTEVPVADVAETKAEEVAPAAAAPAVEAEAPKAEEAVAAPTTEAAPAATEEAVKPAEEAKEVAATTPKKEKRQSTFNKLLAAFQSRTKSFNKKEAAKTEETAAPTEEAKPAATEVSFLNLEIIIFTLLHGTDILSRVTGMKCKRSIIPCIAAVKKAYLARPCHESALA